MPLSKNLYTIEDLCAFFLFSLEHHDVSSAYAVVKELQESLEHDKLESLLVFAWLLTEPSKEFSPQRFTALSEKRYDIFIKTFESTETPVFVEIVPVSIYKITQNVSLYDTLRRFLNKRQVWRAYLVCFSQYYKSPKDLLSLLSGMGILGEPLNIMYALGSYVMPRIVHHCLYILAYPELSSIHGLPCISQHKDIVLSTEAILKWGLNPKSTTYLIGAPNFIYDTSPYWVKQREVYGIQPNFSFNSDTLCDQFYAKNFPNDIPDEWSEEERMKRVGKPIKTNPEQVPKEWQKTLLSILRS
jgi:hypothetical protein